MDFIRAAPHPPVSRRVLSDAFQVLADQGVGSVDSWSLTKANRTDVRPNLIFRISGLMSQLEIDSMVRRANCKGGYELSGAFDRPVIVGAGTVLKLCMGFEAPLLLIPRGYRTLTLWRGADDPPLCGYLHLMPDTIRDLSLHGDVCAGHADMDWTALARDMGGLRELDLRSMSDPLPPLLGVGTNLQALRISHEDVLDVGDLLARFPILAEVTFDAPTVVFGDMPVSLLDLRIDAVEVAHGGQEGVLDLRDCPMLLRLRFEELCGAEPDHLLLPPALVELRLNACFGGQIDVPASLRTVHCSIEYPYLYELGGVSEVILYD